MMSGFVPNGLLFSNIEEAWVGKVIDQKRLSQLEARAAELFGVIKPNAESESHRRAVESYIKNLILTHVPCKIFTFGSLPLKTYLPDGDIDLTCFGDYKNLDENFIPEILHILQSQEKNEHADFKVKEVQYIQAEVKIIKCLVENFVVDISFNMISGLCALCFFEEVDNMVGKSHLFKRSIILIKAWCFYESRILGSNRGLLSTYALEIMVLYIFHLHNNRFSGPFEVLYRFLEFFSKFDWENYCLSLRGPVYVGSLPNIVGVPPRKDCQDLLIAESFLSACQSYYDSMRCSQENLDQVFVSKHFNIMDPLRATNNLGRSVSKSNFLRVKGAIAFGAKQMARLVDCSEENLIPEFDFFFKNTWNRHGNGYWLHVDYYNDHLRNNNQESKVEQAQASLVSQGTSGTTETCDRERKSTIKNAVNDKGKGFANSSNEVHAMHHFANACSSSNSASSMTDNPNIKNFSEYQQSFGQACYDRRSEDAVRLRNASKRYWNEFGSGVNSKIGYYVDEAMGMRQEEHGFVNTTESRRSPHLKGYLQALVNGNSRDVSFPPSQVLARGYGHANSFGAVPVTIPLRGSFLGHNKPSPRFSELRRFPGAKRTVKIEEITEPVAQSDTGRKMAAKSGSSYGNSSSSSKTNAGSHSMKDSVVTSEQKSSTREKGNDRPPAETYVQALKLTGHGKGPVTQSNSPVSVTQLLVGPSSSQRAADNKSLSPFVPQFPFVTGTTYMDVKSSVTEQRQYSDASHDYYVKQDETSVNQNADILDGDFLSYWLNLQHGRICQNGQIEEPLFYPPPVAPPLYCPPQDPLHMIPPQFPEIPSSLVPFSRDNGIINQCITFWLPRLSAGTGTFLPEPDSYLMKCVAWNSDNKVQNRSYGSSREKFSSNDHSQRHVQKLGNSSSNKKFSGHGQFNKQAEKDRFSKTRPLLR